MADTKRKMAAWVPPIVDDAFLQEMTKVIVETVHPDEVMLFGSRARGDHQVDSDMDLMVVLPDSEEVAHDRRKISGSLYRALSHFLIPKDILIYSSTEAARKKLDRFSVVNRAYAEGRCLYAR
jgi:predicted nucleotidyltransferase